MPAVSEEQVRGLHISMHDSFAVGGVKSIGDFDTEIEQALKVEWVLEDDFLQRLPLQALHHNEGKSLKLADFVNGTDIRMV